MLFPAFLFALLTSILASYFNYWSGIACLLLLLCFRLPEKFVWSNLSYAVVTYCAVVIVNLLFIDTAYTAEDFYYIAYLTIGFIVFSQLSLNQIISIYKLIVCLFIGLSVWAIIQYYTGSFYIVNAGLRSNTIFTTANTFSAAINLILLPLIAINLSSKNRHILYTAMLLLFYALLVTRSRGGMLSFFIGCSAIVIFVFINNIQRRIHWKKVAIGLTAIFLLFLASHLIDWQSDRQQSEFDLFEVTRLEGVSEQVGHRLVLYETAWQKIKESPFLGQGYHNFQYYWLKDKKPPFNYMNTKFAHNDYLQIWMEVGILGLAAMIAIIAFFYYQLWRRFKQINDDSLPVILGLIGGLSAYFAHAMVDFVIYPCFLTLLFGAYLGTAMRVSKPETEDSFLLSSIRSKVGDFKWNIKFWRIFACVLAITGLSQPYLAELAFKQAEKNLELGQIKLALPFYELARRFAPYNAFYYAKEGTFLRYLVINGVYSEQTAQRADQLFADGAKANPYDVRNVLSRAVLNRDYPELLSSPADNSTIIAWFDHVLFWEPGLIAGQYEYVKTLYQFGQKKKAKELLDKFIIKNPGSDKLIKLKDELLL